MQSKLIKYSGKTVNNFPVAVPPADSELVNIDFED